MVSKILSFFNFSARLLAFWLLFFASFRLWFWAQHCQNSSRPLPIFQAALPLDFSTAGYLLALPLLIFCIGWATKKEVSDKFSNLIFWFNCLLISVLVIVFTSNIFLYAEWQTLLNHRAVEYLKTPAGLLDSMSGWFKIGSVVLLVSLVWVWVKIYSRFVGRDIFPKEKTRWALLAAPVILAGTAIAIRGGFGVMPINESAVYFSEKMEENHAATNTAWHFIHSLVEARVERNPFIFMEKEQAQQIRDSIFDYKICKIALNGDSLKNVNVCLIVMESMTAQVIESLGGERGICPNLDKLAAEGISFENIYSSGYRTDQGLVSILSGFPAQPDQSVILLEDKMTALPALPKIFKNKNYSTAFFYGGETTFANLGLYLRHAGFDKILSEKDFPKSEKTQRWGVDDRHFLRRVKTELDALPQPFFATALTLSLHPPYDFPLSDLPVSASERDKFLAAAKFADAAIGEFLAAAAQSAWFEKTLFVFVADHGSGQPNGLGLDNPKARQVPLIFWKKNLNFFFNPLKISCLGNHHDLPKTLLDHFFPEIRTDSLFKWSNILTDKITPAPTKLIDLTDKTRPNSFANNHFNCSQHQDFAYFTNENGMGWMTSRSAGFFDFKKGEWQNVGEVSNLDDVQKTQAKAYLQTLYDDFLELGKK